MRFLIVLSVLLQSTFCFATAPSKMVLQNQYGEVSINVLQGSVLPISPSGNLILLAGATAPVDGSTGDNVAAKGSLYIAKDTGALYYNSGVITNPTWTAIGAGTTATLLTGLSIGAGTVSGADTVLQGFNKVVGNANVLKNGTFTPTSETVSAAGALSTVAMESVVSNGTGGSFAVTLAAPSSQDGQMKIIKMATATHTVTMALTNVSMSGSYTPTGTTTLTFTSVGDSAVFMAVGAKWVYMGGSAIAS